MGKEGWQRTMEAESGAQAARDIRKMSLAGRAATERVPDGCRGQESFRERAGGWRCIAKRRPSNCGRNTSGELRGQSPGAGEMERGKDGGIHPCRLIAGSRPSPQSPFFPTDSPRLPEKATPIGSEPVRAQNRIKASLWPV